MNARLNVPLLDYHKQINLFAHQIKVIRICHVSQQFPFFFFLLIKLGENGQTQKVRLDVDASAHKPRFYRQLRRWYIVKEQ